MGTITAHILVGMPHPSHDGINPTHQLFLVENDRSGWFLVPYFNYADAKEMTKITWIPTTKHTLEDAILMIAIHVLKDREVILLAEKYFKNPRADFIELYKEVTSVQLKELYMACRNIGIYYKIIISLFKSCSIYRELKVLEEYKMDVEVCTPVFSRLYSAWTNKTNISGTLDLSSIYGG